MNRRKVARQLFLIVALAALGVTAVGSVSIEVLRRRSAAAAEHSLRVVAEQTALRIEGFVANERETLRAVGAALAQEPDAQRRLEEVTLDAPSLRRVTLALSATTLDHSHLSAADVERARSGTEVASPLYIGDDGTPAQDLCVPAHSLPGAAVCATLDLLELWRFVQHVRVGESGYALAFDREGHLIASGAGAIRGAILTGEPVAESAAARDAAADLERAPHRYASALREDVIAGWAGVPSAGWTVVAEQPAREALAAARNAQITLALLAVLILGAAVAFGSQRAHRILTEFELEERWRTAGRIATGITHDLGHRLAILQQTAALAETGDAAYLPRIQDNLRSEVTMLRKFIADFHDLSRDVKTVERLPLELDAFAASVQRSAAAHAERAGVRVEVEAAGAPVWVAGDRYLLERATLNLVNNAIEASKPGGVVRIAVARADAKGLVAVHDQGSGISAERLPHIFDAFLSTKRTGAHVGMGLPNVKRIVDAHGGTVSASSDPGAGSTFTIALPLTAAP